MSTEVAISGHTEKCDKKKEAGKIVKHKACMIEIEHMWTVNTEVIPVIIGASGTISKSSSQYLSNISGKHKIKVLQKTATLGTAHCGKC